jgi:hypothetical protein
MPELARSLVSKPMPNTHTFATKARRLSARLAMASPEAAGRGTGFSQLFKSLASLNASLRFRSGDHALSIDGKSPTLVTAKVAKKPRAVGFLTCVLCRLQ